VRVVPGTPMDLRSDTVDDEGIDRAGLAIAEAVA
jgi:hypothetical protein